MSRDSRIDEKEEGHGPCLEGLEAAEADSSEAAKASSKAWILQYMQGRQENEIDGEVMRGPLNGDPGSPCDNFLVVILPNRSLTSADMCHHLFRMHRVDRRAALRTGRFGPTLGRLNGEGQRGSGVRHLSR